MESNVAVEDASKNRNTTPDSTPLISLPSPFPSFTFGGGGYLSPGKLLRLARVEVRRSCLNNAAIGRTKWDLYIIHTSVPQTDEDAKSSLLAIGVGACSYEA